MNFYKGFMHRLKGESERLVSYVRLKLRFSVFSSFWMSYVHILLVKAFVILAMDFWCISVKK